MKKWKKFHEEYERNSSKSSDRKQSDQKKKQAYTPVLSTKNNSKPNLYMSNVTDLHSKKLKKKQQSENRIKTEFCQQLKLEGFQTNYLQVKYHDRQSTERVSRPYFKRTSEKYLLTERSKISIQSSENKSINYEETSSFPDVHYNIQNIRKKMKKMAENMKILKQNYQALKTQNRKDCSNFRKLMQNNWEQISQRIELMMVKEQIEPKNIKQANSRQYKEYLKEIEQLQVQKQVFVQRLSFI